MNSYQNTQNNTASSSQSSESQRGLVTFQAEIKKKETGVSTPSSRSARAINEQQMDLNYGTDSAILRDTLTWTSAGVVGATIAQYNLPRDLLAMGGTDVVKNLQNMPFDRFLFWEGDVEVSFQVAGQPFQQGLLIAYWMPLASHKPSLQDRPFCQCVYLSPNDSSFVSMRIPFRFYLPAMNTFAMERGEESLGVLRIDVLSQLKSLSASDVSINVYSKFPNSKFSIPRPPTSTSYRTLSMGCYRTRQEFDEDLGDYTCEPLGEDEVYVADDGRKSRLERGVMTVKSKGVDVCGNYDFEAQGLMDVVSGLLGGVTGGKKENPNPLGGLANIVMDNPMIASTSAPVVNQYSGLSKSNGPEPTTSLQLNPEALYKVHNEKFEPEEHKISHILGKECFLKRRSWEANQAPKSELMTLNLNSLFVDTLAPDAGGGYSRTDIPTNVALLNWFEFWKADVVFRIVAVKTQFHVGRLRATIAYGAPGLKSSEQTLFYNQILDFTGPEQSHEIRIPYNSNREYLRTYEGDHAPHKQQNYSLGYFGLYVANTLKYAPTVIDNVDILVFVRFENVHVAVPRACPITRFFAPTSVSDTEEYRIKITNPAEYSFVAQGMEDTQEDVIVTGTLMDDGGENKQAAVTETEIVEVPRMMCSLKPGEKFEYEVTSVIDMLRRAYRYRPYEPITNSIFTQKDDLYLQGQADRLGAVYFGDACLKHPLMALYAGWAGGVKYRFFTNTQFNPGMSVKYFPYPHEVNQARRPMVGSLFDPEYEDRITPGGTDPHTYASSYAGVFGCAAPQEQGFPLANQSYIDVHVPYQSEYDFTVNEYTTIPGLIAMAVNTADVAGIVTYASAADDFSPGILVPPKQAYMLPYIVDAQGTTISKLGRQFALWYAD